MIASANRVSGRWTRYWFGPTLPTNLAVCRVVFVGFMLLRYRLVPIDANEAAAWVNVPKLFWHSTPFLGCLELPVLRYSVVRMLEVVWTAALVAGCVGLVTRLSTSLAFAVGLYLLWLPHNFGKLHHMDGLAVLVLGILAASRCGDAWSVDRVLRQVRYSRGAPPAAYSASGNYTWPLRAVQLLIATVYLEAGISKLRNGGLEWILSDNLSLMFLKANYNAYTGIPPLTSLGVHLAPYRWLCQVLAGATVILEVGYPIALASRRLRTLWVSATLAATVGMFCLVVPAFIELIVCHIFWVPWDTLMRRDRGGWCVHSETGSGSPHGSTDSGATRDVRFRSYRRTLPP